MLCHVLGWLASLFTLGQRASCEIGLDLDRTHRLHIVAFCLFVKFRKLATYIMSVEKTNNQPSVGLMSSRLCSWAIISAWMDASSLLLQMSEDNLI